MASVGRTPYHLAVSFIAFLRLSRLHHYFSRALKRVKACLTAAHS